MEGLDHTTEVLKNGSSFARAVYNAAELDVMICSFSVKKDQETYAVRQVMREVPELKKLVFNPQMKGIIAQFFNGPAFVTKSIWFDKPAGGNWFVGYHQDISICVAGRAEVAGYSRWTSRQGMIGVVPPVEILQNTLTLRIHLDRADASNGALKVRPGTHRSGIIQPSAEGIPEVECPMEAGDVMLMRPLLLHASMRSTKCSTQGVASGGDQYGTGWRLELERALADKRTGSLNLSCLDDR